MQVCRVCLAMDSKLYDMREHRLDLLYEQTTGLLLDNEDKLPQKLCWECAHRLVGCSRFKGKAARSQGLMMEMLLASHYLTSRNIKSIDRITHNLASTLTNKVFNVNHNDLHLYDTAPLNSEKTIEDEKIQEIEDEKNQEVEKIQEVNIQFDIDIKSEDENYSNDVENSNFDNNSTSSSDVVLAKHKNKKNKRKSSNCKKDITTPKVDRRRKPANAVLNEEIFVITDLSYDEQIFEIHKRKESSNYTRSEFKCVACFKGFLDEEAFKCHMIRHTEQSGSFECEICKVRFKNQHALRNHTTSHVQKFSCRQCVYVTTRRHAAKLHEDYHNGTRYQCPHCLEDFGKFSTYMSHVRIKHPSDFVCALCGFSFVSSKGLGLHKKLKHRFDDTPVPPDGPHCERCDVRFVSADALHRHLKLSARHNDQTNLTENGIRRRPRRQHDEQEKRAEKKISQKKRPNYKPEGPIPCEQCDMQLPDSISYYRHFRRSHPDKNRTNYPSMKSKSMCEVCGKMFQSLALLQDHSFTHNDAKQFKCAQCDKTFQRKYRLIAHRRLHADQRASHACAVCGKHFTTTSNMQRHMVVSTCQPCKSHTGLKPFKCEMCGKCFKHASEKRVHITYVHLKKPWPKRTRGKRRPDGRQNPLPAHSLVPTSTDMDIVQPLWPACNDPKIADIAIDDKPVYYNLKI